MPFKDLSLECKRNQLPEHSKQLLIQLRHVLCEVQNQKVERRVKQLSEVHRLSDSRLVRVLHQQEWQCLAQGPEAHRSQLGVLSNL